MKNDIYLKVLQLDDNQLVIDYFYNTLLITNRSFDFFTNWKKIKKNFSKYRIELNTLSALINDENFDDTLKTILLDHPKVLPVIPMLLAVRSIKIPIIDNFYSEKIKNYNIDFSIRKLKIEEIDEIVLFFRDTGLKDFFMNLSQKSIPDYYIGVEVGLDTHARKNRSGKVMEKYILNILNEINMKKEGLFRIFTQRKYEFLKKDYSYKINSALIDRKADFILVRNDQKIIAIETNFYSGTGSKPQEIVNSYIQRQDELKKIGVEFIWITDGFGWTKQKNQMNLAFERLNFISNIAFLKMGLLEQIIMSV